ncbi:MAG TPA: S9 family peptidase [Gemmatimonadales bacterium]|nr:S9 family peptidase [Gemmatimonadales bacterium]
MRRLLVALPLLLATPLAAQQAAEPDSSTLTLERIFTTPFFAANRPPQLRWTPDGKSFYRFERREGQTAADMVQVDPATGAQTVIVPGKQLVPAGDTAALRPAGVQFSDDGRTLLLYTNTARVWRQNTRGDYWVLDRGTGKLRKLGGKDARPQTLMFAKFSPQGDRVAYVRENNIYVESVKDGKIRALTKDGSRTTINGTFDWVYEEEFGLRDGFRWSPDGKSIAYWQLDATGVRDFLLINNTDSLYSFTIPVQYPKAGTTNSAVRIGVVGADGGSTRWMAAPGAPRDIYLARMEWAANSSELVIQHLNRLQNTLTVLLADAKTGRTSPILVEKDEAWVDVVDDWTWLDGGKRFVWISERDGWQHAWSVSRDGKDVKLLTPGDYDVVNVQAIDTTGGTLYFTASPENATQRYLYKVPLTGGAATRLSPAGQSGTHQYSIAPGAAYAVHTFSNYTTPPTTQLIRLPSHEPVRPLAENAALARRYENLRKGPVKFVRVDAGNGVTLDGIVMYPPGFDSTRKYPVLFHVYGEPAAQTALDAWGANDGFHQYIAQQGYIVATFDNRGTPAPKGRAWRKSVYRKLGVLATEDQTGVARAMGRWAGVDSTRFAVWGWSGGGSMTLNMLFRSPDVFKTGMSVAPVPDVHLYDTIYQERYMGLPQQNEADYVASSPLTFANQLKGNLLVVHGSGDDNVHYQGTERLVNALVKHNRPFQLMVYPNRTHGIYEGEGTTLHLYSLLSRYLMEHLEAGAR